MSALDTRLAQRSAGGVLGPSGVTRFRKLFASAQSAEVFHKWSEHPITKALAGAVSDLALHGPAAELGDSQNVAVQYGVSLGLALAARLMEDPSSVYPELFSNPDATAPVVPEMTFSADPFDLGDQEN